MRKVLQLLIVFLIWTIVGSISKMFFMATYASLMGDISIADWWQVVRHGLPLDFAIAGYLSILPGLMLIVSIWYSGKVLRYLWDIYFFVASFLLAIAFVVNIGLYGYWGFPLDSTPLLYLKTSPADAMASVTLWQAVGGILAILLATAAIFVPFHLLYNKVAVKNVKWKIVSAALLLLATVALIIPIRGGFSTGTNHTGTVYYSSNIRLNHAAVNPMFCFIESVIHRQDDIAAEYHAMDDTEAEAIFKTLTNTTLRSDSNIVLSKKDVNVVFICLESFSRYITGRSGNIEGVTPNIDRYSKEGLYFSNFYANSFRTDRALVSILSGLPAQPSMSIMDMARKSTSLPSIARTLDKYSYTTSFYYGGDTNYSNMQSYLVGTGYQNVISENDFPKKVRTGKWGVADGPVFERMLEDIKKEKDDKPFFMTIMTESSHEPFDMPYKGSFNEPSLNAFQYADKCLGEFIEGLRKLPCWENTLVVIVPDHLGCYPENSNNYATEHYESFLIMLGGAISNAREIDVLGSQIDIAATLLSLLGMEHQDFPYSKDILDKNVPHYAFFCPSSAFGMVTDSTRFIYNNYSEKLDVSEGSGVETTLKQGRAILQVLHNFIAGL